MSAIPPSSQDPSGVFFWARCGGGHRTAKEGVKQQMIKTATAKGQTFRVKEDVDITGEKVLSSIRLPFFGGLGDMGVNSWDEAQKKGDLKYLERYASWGWLAEIILYPLVYFRVKWMLQDLKEKPDFVVSTQAFCLNAIMRAMQTVNKEKNWNMHMHLYLTDMPSKKAIHFFPSIRKVTDDTDLQKMITLHAPPPLRKPGKGEEADREFWQKYCGNINVITNEQFPIREAFLDSGKLNQRFHEDLSVDVNIKLNEPSEREIITQGLSGAVKPVEEENRLRLHIRNHDKVGFLMLGSQPTTQSVLRWLDTFVAQSHAKRPEEGDDTQRYFFLYCGAAHTKDTRNPLLDAVQEQIKKYKEAGQLAPNFNIVPFTNQEAEEIALLMARSDVSITRSGGATAMELMQLYQADLPKRANKLTLIHSEALQSGASPQVLDQAQFAQKIAQEMAVVKGRKELLDSEEWKEIKMQMLRFCIQLGYSEEEAKRIVLNVVNKYIYSQNMHEGFEELFSDLKKLAHVTAPLPGYHTRIETQVKKMKEKPKYEGFQLHELRPMAIEKVLMKEGIVLWEAGNAKYLQRRMNAHITNPHFAANLVADSFF